MDDVNDMFRDLEQEVTAAWDAWSELDEPSLCARRLLQVAAIVGKITYEVGKQEIKEEWERRDAERR